MLYNVKVNHEDLGEFESAEKLWQAEEDKRDQAKA